jgi:thiamine transport system permease protein
LAALPLTFLAAVLLAPTLRLLLESAHYGGAAQGCAGLWLPWTDAYLRARMGWSALQAAITCALCLGIGLPIAWVLARFEFAGRAWLLRLLMLPFVVPTVVAALGVLALLGPSGWLAQAGGADLQETPYLLLYGNVFFNLCVVVRAGVAGLERVSAAHYGVARSLGATPWRVFWRVEWPLAAPWFMSALCLVFLYCFSGFGLALVLGGQRYSTIEVEIYTLVAHELQLGKAGVVALWTLVLTGCVAMAYGMLEAKLGTPARADTIARRRPARLRHWAYVLAAVLALWVLCALPLLAIVLHALFSLPHAWGVLLESETLQALWNTLRFSVLALGLACVLGVLHALAAQRSLFLRTLSYLPLLVSPVMVAFGLLLLYPDASGSLGLLVAAYALLAYPFVAKALTASLDSIPPNVRMAARSLGASPWRVAVRVVLPLLAPALRRGMAFAAATALGEFAVTLFFSRPEWATLTTLIYQHLGRPGTANKDAAMLLACLLMGLALLVFMAIEPPPKAKDLQHA